MTKKKHKEEIDCKLKDCKGREVLLPVSVLKKHLQDACHNESYDYYETLKENFCNPESVVRSRTNRNTLIFNIKLNNRKHKYLIVVVVYNNFIRRLSKQGNFIVTFYGDQKPKAGKIIWPK